MGILDDAIRQHLELKRQHGAGDDDLERLEKEAFGPATRPGDPDFEEPPSEELQAAEPPSEELVAAEPPSEELTAAEPPSEEQPSAEAPVAEPPSEEAELAPDATPAEQARVEHAELGDTADHPAPTQLGPADEAEPAPSEAAPSTEEPPEAPEAGIFDAEEFDFADLDLGLEEDAEADAGGTTEPAAEPAVELEPEPVAEPEPGSEPQPASDPEATLVPEPAAGPEPVVEPELDPDATLVEPAEQPAAPEEERTATEGGEDLLEETPDFLQETPEGEDLWFEQGPPRDFDFDDD